MTNEEKLKSPKRVFLFCRENGFYPLDIPEATVEDNALLNPGTLKVIHAATGKVVWRKSYPCRECGMMGLDIPNAICPICGGE